MNNSQIQEMWVDKYRPKTLENYILNSDIKRYFTSMIQTGKLQNMTFIGTQGSGKTTLAKILSNEFNAETLFIKCATDGTLDVLRTRISEFCNAMSFDGRIKIVILDEVDSASSSGQNNFQLGLRTLIESAQSDTRFILTANYNKVIPAILSRCPVIPLTFDKKDLLTHVKFILDSEKIEYNKTSLKSFIEDSFQFYPDCRRIINYLQFCCASGSLVVKLNSAANSEKADFIKDIMSMIIENKNILDIRRFYLQNKEKISDYVIAGSDLYNYVIDNGYVDCDGILTLTELLYQLNQVIDKEVGFFGMITAVAKWKI